MNLALCPPGVVEILESKIDPTETLLEVCRFLHYRGKDVQPPVYAVLTNRYFHMMVIWKAGRGKWKLRDHSQIPISRISAVQTGVFKKSVRLSLFWEGLEETLVGSEKWMDEAKEFAEHTRMQVTTREVRHESTGVADEIAKLSQLASEGILSEDELERAKSLMLGRPTSDIDQSVVLLKNLHTLYRQKVLSESEFNMKKWDVLSKKDFQ